MVSRHPPNTKCNINVAKIRDIGPPTPCILIWNWASRDSRSIKFIEGIKILKTKTNLKEQERPTLKTKLRQKADLEEDLFVIKTTAKELH